MNDSLNQTNDVLQTKSINKSTVGKGEVAVRTATDHITKVTDLLNSTQDDMNSYNAQKQRCQKYLKDLETKGNNVNENVLNTLKSIFENIYSNLTIKITQQKQENEKLQQKIVNLKKEKTDIQQIIIASAKRCATLEQELGKYPN